MAQVPPDAALERALTPTYLDRADRATLAILRDRGVSITHERRDSVDDRDDARVDVETLETEHSSTTDGRYKVVSGCVWLDVRDSADAWVRCMLLPDMSVTLRSHALRRFVPVPHHDAVHLVARHPQGASTLVPRFSRPADAACHTTRMNAAAWRDLVCELCRLYYTTEWMTGTGGAMSLRHGERIYVTPSGVPKERLQPEHLYVLDLHGTILSRPNAPTGTTTVPKLSDCAPLFLKAHELRQAAVVLHSHGLTCNLAAALCDGQREFRISHQEMIKGIAGRSYSDTLVVPVIENAPKESALTDPMAQIMEAYPQTCAVLVRRHGLFVWGDSWEAAKRHAECLHYLFQVAIEMRKLQLDYTVPPVSSKALTRAETHKVVILDIEGTTTPITFVHDVLFPYVTKNVQRFLEETWNVPETIADVAALVAQHAQDEADGATPPPLASGHDQDTLLAALSAYVKWNVAADRKIGPLKQLQGHMWLRGYESGELEAQVYDDVPPCLAQWCHRGMRVGIYSSGSRQAQKLLFQYSNHGDLRKYVSVYFDTTIGHKREVESYKEIVQTLGVDRAHDILFVTDVLEEAQAAKTAGLDVVLSVRPGNQALPESHAFPVIHSFHEL